MTAVQTVLIFVAIPVAVYLVLAALIWGRRPKNLERYELGQAWTGPAVWFRGHPREGQQPGPVSDSPPALTAGSSEPAAVEETLKGGASGNW